MLTTVGSAAPRGLVLFVSVFEAMALLAITASQMCMYAFVVGEISTTKQAFYSVAPLVIVLIIHVALTVMLALQHNKAPFPPPSLAPQRSTAAVTS